jgi:hypothetical protein
MVGIACVAQPEQHRDGDDDSSVVPFEKPAIGRRARTS